MTAPTSAVERLEIPDDFEAANDFLYERGWTDGLPVVPPTEERVARLLAATSFSPDTVLGRVAPVYGEATVELVAVNAVMAGCRPECFSVVLAAVEAVSDPVFNLHGLQATTNPVTPLIVVNGPIARELGINGGGNAFGQGFRANATIGRSVRLVMNNIGGGKPQLMDKATQGQPGKYTFCVAENEAESPWEPLHVEKGFEREQSCVSAVGVTGTQNILDYATQTPRGMLQTLCSALTFGGMQNVQLGWGPVIGLCPEHAQIIASGGYSKADCKRHLYEHARLRRSDLSRELFEDVIQRRRPIWVTSDNPDDLITVADHWDDFTIVVVGGPGPHSAIMPTFGESTCVSTKLVRG